MVYTGDPTCPEAAGWTPEQQALYESMATQYLWNWTGRVLGTCPLVVRPCRSDCDTFTTFWGYGPYTHGYALTKSRNSHAFGPMLIQGQWFNLGCGSCGDNCSCDESIPALRLPSPVASIVRVMQDGEELPADAYRVDNQALLVRLDGHGWPTCQDMTVPYDAEGAFAVEYLYGSEVPPQGQLAAGVLACEFAKAAVGDASCQLPRRVQTIARQGITTTFLDDMDNLDKGRTGIWLVDSWVASMVNPPRPGRVYSVDIPRPRVRVTTWP